MKYYLLLIIVIFSPIKSLDASVHYLDPRSVEATPPYGSGGSCYTWGRGAFRTFQDDFFYFTSRCNFILSRQCKGPAEDFNIQIRRGSNGNLQHIHMLIEGVSIITENGTVRVKDEIIKLPYDDKIITIQKYGVYTRITNRKHSISLIWNHHDSLSITLDIKYKNQTCGLCGGFQEGTGINTDSDEVIYNIMVANQLDVLGHVCVTDQQTGSACTAANSCISPISMYFSTCFANPTFTNNYLKLCQRDVCACGNMKECTCATFEELARQCTNLPAISDDDYEFFGPNWKEWRSTISCGSPACPENQFYKECGAMCVPTCSDPETQQQCDQCVNACECPKGTVLDDIRDTGRCIDKTACPCEYGGMIYSPELLRNTSCHSCVCQSGMWECSDISCPGRCKIEEGTHFTTFDNKYYTLKGDCTYFAVVTKSWTVMIELRPCQIAFEQTCLQRVMFNNNQTWYAFTNDGNVYSEGNKIGLPFARGDITIFQQSSMFLQVATNSGMKMQVQISPIMQLYISLPEDAQGSTKGLCGTFNDNANDDFLSAYNIVEDAPLSFANSWEAENDCPETEMPAPCVSSENEHYAQQHCSYLKDPVDAFSVCHPTVDYMKYYQMCVAATCACENINDCLCAALGAYVHECAAHGVTVRSWRKDICNKSCSNSQVFENDMRTCNRTCRSLSESDYTCSIKDVPVYGCGCPEKKYMDENGVCVDRSDCSCYTEGRLIEKGQSINMHGIPCICRDGKLHCFPVTADPWPPGCPHGKVFVDCTNGTASSSQYFCGKTCRTLSTPCSPCVPDCICPHGLVEDDDGNCIVRENCPCLFSGALYSDGRIIQRNCNKCTCQGGSWNCTSKVCPKTCEVYGDGHYITFDGKRYVYNGNCEYIFVEDQCNRREGTLQILTESVPCCEKGMTCSRNIRILLEGKELILTDNHVETVERFTNQTHCSDDFYSRHTIGLYLILKFSNGITVIWDKSTRLSITLDSRWKNKVCGLCGNFNDDVSDDLTTKGNSLVTSAVEFGNSWKSMICSDTVNQTSACDRNPYCLAWAQRKCGIIKHDMFQSCHKKVDPTPFYDGCVQEACACDLEGKYLGFCTAVAVYAEACNKAGVCVDWRTPERCPVYCDYYNTPGECSWHYRPCGTLTAKTCSDHYIGKKFSAVLEGCYAKCPENAPYLDENRMKCVNLSECTCYYNGKILEAGERSNDCRYCVCIDGNVNCTESDCDGEWSVWFNENTPTLQNRADTELLNQMHSPLCPFSPYKITAIRCEALKFAQLPISEMKDNVTCDKETGLVCTYNPQNSEGDLTCLDYRIRVCCKPLLTSTSPTTQTTAMTRNITIETTSTSTTEQTTPTSTVTTEQTTLTTTVTTEQTTPTTTVTTEQTTPTTTVTTEQPTPTITVTTEQTTPTTTGTTEQTAPTTTVTTEQTIPTTIVTTEQTTPTTTVTTEQTKPTTIVTTEQTTPTTTVTTEQATPTTTVTTEQATPTTTVTTEQATPITTVTTEQAIAITISTTEQTTPTSTVTTEQTTPTSTVTTEQTTLTTTVTTEQTTPTTTVTTEQPTPTTTVTTEQTTPTTTVTTEQPTPTITVTTEQTTPTTTVTTEQTTPTTTVTTEQTIPTTIVTTEQTTPTTTVTTEQTTPTTIVTTEQTTPTTTVTTEQATPTTTVTTEQATPTTTVTTEQATPITTVTTEQAIAITISTTEQTTPTSTVTTEQTTPTTTVTTEHTPITTVTTEQATPTTTVTTEQTTPITIDTTEQTTATTTVTTEPATPITISTTEQTTPTTTVTTEQTTPTTAVTTEQTTPRTTVSTEQTAPTTTVTTEQTAPTTTVTTEQTAPTTTVTTEQTITSTSATELPTTPCLSVAKPTCLKPSKILDANGCPKWDCYCQCQVWGDPHYLTFGGTQYDFFDNCTYTLMEERVPKYNFSVQVDNYYCFPQLPMSCAREITMFYNENVVTITTGFPQIITFDGESVTVPYSLNGINIHSMRQNIFISIPDIQASIIAFGDSFRIRLSQKYFLNNTQGQCGSCVDDSSGECARRNGEILPPDCCHITANDWKVFDPKKPYCQSTPTNLPCTTNSPPPVPPTCHPGATLCELLLGKAFEDCRKQNQEDFELFYNSCLFDHCHTNSTKFDCSSLQASAIACTDGGICVDWRNFTNGQCNYTCPDGFIYKPCEHQDNVRCEKNMLISGQELYPLSEGCFCPQGMMLSENMTTCVNTCCTDSSGDPKDEGETWPDPTDECVINTCLNSQVVASENVCCQGGRFWKNNHCSKSCRKQFGHCEILLISKNITMENSSCSAEVLMTRCEGNCPGWSEFDTVTNTMINECGCCQPTAIENKTVILDCENGDNMPYNYTDIKSCNCIGNTCYNQYFF
ncbi:mucin-2-like isoform X2 [Scyliorhinus torazame]|uniref:mucin-2-like isoform X2 n=1 Tax=Scyliorhinus torazame TaxID=75743 RepID=UPI003B595BA4